VLHAYPIVSYLMHGADHCEPERPFRTIFRGDICSGARVYS